MALRHKGFLLSPPLPPTLKTEKEKNLGFAIWDQPKALEHDHDLLPLLTSLSMKW